jgi:hypothetical protein
MPAATHDAKWLFRSLRGAKRRGTPFPDPSLMGLLRFGRNDRVRPLRNLKIRSRKRALEIFRGTLPPQRSACKDDCLSAEREFRLCSEARRRRVEKCPARGGIVIFQTLRVESARRAVTCCGALLFALLFWMQTAFADEALLRGPRKVSRAPVTVAGPSAEKEGALEEIAAAPVLFYQRFLGPYWGHRCPSYPSCSNYALLAIRKHGALVGLVMAFDRLQHESNEARYSVLLQSGGEIKVYDPLENNDYWWYTSDRSQPAESEAKP